MFDPFGTRRRLVINTKNFQKNLILLKDYRDLINGMYDSCGVSIALDRNDSGCSYITLNLSAHIINDNLRFELNNLFKNIYCEKAISPELREKLISKSIDNIIDVLFPNHTQHIIYKRLVDSGRFDTLYFFTDCFGISKNYIPTDPTDDEIFYFSYSLILKTCFLDEYRDGNRTMLKDKFDRIDERDFYAKILLEELKKI